MSTSPAETPSGEVLTESDRTREDQLKRIVRIHLESFIEAGEALLEIRDKGLFRVTHKTFEEYCQANFRISRQHAHRLITGAQTAERIGLATGVAPAAANTTSPMGDTPAAELPSERAIRPLAQLEDAEARAAYERASELAGGAPPSHVHVEQAIAELAARPGMRLDALMSSATPEHYTPSEILVDVRVALGGTIELDPCSNDGPPAVPAERYYRRADDGLSKPWIAASIFLNPPFGREIDLWVVKLASEVDGGNVRAAIALVPARVDTRWWDVLTTSAKSACFLRGRLTFVGNDDPAPFPTALIYLGPDDAEFRRVFGERGSIWTRVDLGARAIDVRRDRLPGEDDVMPADREPATPVAAPKKKRSPKRKLPAKRSEDLGPYSPGKPLTPQQRKTADARAQKIQQNMRARQKAAGVTTEGGGG